MEFEEYEPEHDDDDYNDEWDEAIEDAYDADPGDDYWEDNAWKTNRIKAQNAKNETPKHQPKDKQQATSPKYLQQLGAKVTSDPNLAPEPQREPQGATAAAQGAPGEPQGTPHPTTWSMATKIRFQTAYLAPKLPLEV